VLDSGRLQSYTHTRLERIAKHSSLLQTFVNIGRKMFYKIGLLRALTATSSFTSTPSINEIQNRVSLIKLLLLCWHHGDEKIA
jgi:hypothetical protein